MTLDVKDPAALPLLPSNVWVICRTCNFRKRLMTFAEWCEFGAYVQWLQAAGSGQGTLFEDIVAAPDGRCRGGDDLDEAKGLGF